MPPMSSDELKRGGKTAPFSFLKGRFWRKSGETKHTKFGAFSVGSAFGKPQKIMVAKAGNQETFNSRPKGRGNSKGMFS